MNKYLYVFFMLAFFMTACYKFSPLSVSAEKAVINFYINDETLSNTNAKYYYFQDFGVSKNNCEIDCVVWEIVLKKNITLVELKAGQFSINYGDVPVGYEERHKSEVLPSGRYTAGGTVVFYDENHKLKGESVFLRFELVAGDSGHMVIKNR